MSGSVKVECPECHKISEIGIEDRTAAEFCTGLNNNTLCDYPLFWAPTFRASFVADQDTDGALRRLPGVRGREQDDTIACPACGELNDPTGIYCTRTGCGKELRPKPPPPPPPAAPVVHRAATPAPVASKRVWTWAWWPWPIITLVTVVEAALFIIWLS
jgi:phage FluMu protein Com